MRDLTATSDRLVRLLAEEAPGRGVEVLACEPITGGYSRVMTRVRLRWDDGSEEDLVLRSDPVAGEVVYLTDRRAEWEILQALTATGVVPMPAARFYDEGRHLETPTIILEWCEGPSLQRLISEDGADLTARAAQVAATLGAIHRTDPGVVRVAPTPPAWDEYIGGLIDQWAQAERAHPEAVPVLRYLGAWLSVHRPPPVDYTLVHGDFQGANLLCTGDDLQIIDWEFAHIGDPREDLGWFNIYSASSGGPNLYALDPEAFLAGYRAATGSSAAAVNQVTVAYFSVLAATRVYLDILRSAGAMAKGEARGILITYNLNALAIGNANWLATCQALEGAL